VRRWYGTYSRVLGCGRVWEVEAWQQYDDGHIWLLLIDPENEDGDLGRHWASIADVRRCEVPQFRPHLDRGVPHLHRYIPAGAA
jgi:hypothetical protein